MADYDDQVDDDFDDLGGGDDERFRPNVDLDQDDEVEENKRAEQDRRRTFEAEAEKERVLQKEWRRTADGDERQTKARVARGMDAAKTTTDDGVDDRGGEYIPAAESRDDRSTENTSATGT